MLAVQGAHLSFELEAGSPKIQKQPNINSGGREVVDGLHLGCGDEVLNSFEFEQNFLLDQDVDLKFADENAILMHVDRFVALESQPGFSQLMSQSIPIN